MQVYTSSHFTTPEFEVKKIAVDDLPEEVDGILVCVEKKGKDIRKTQTLEKLNEKFGIYRLFEKVGFVGSKPSVFTFSWVEKGKTTYVSFAGAFVDDESHEEKLDAVREAVSKAVCELRDKGCETVAVFDGEHTVEIAEAIFLGLYRYEKYKSSGSRKRIKKVIFTRGKARDIQRVKTICDVVNWVRDIQNEPGNAVNPATFAQFASALAEEVSLGCKIYDFEQIKSMGMGGIVAVGQGSQVKPKLVHLWWKPKGAKRKVGVVGKAITFDSGGLSLKPPQHMVTMKYDKSGACAVLGIMKLCSLLEVDVEVHGVFAPCENMPSGTAQRPDDIIRMYNGTTVEVENTDAEGRLTLADAIWYCCEQGVSEVVDFATLTGACIVALGEHTAGVMGNDRDFVKSICDIGNRAGERMWQLPFNRYLDDKLKSTFADVKNVGDRWGGAITAGLFLRRFVPKGVRWAHIDIAGPAYVSSPYSLWRVKGGSGFGVRTLIRYLTGEGRD